MISIDLMTVVYILLYLLAGNFIALIDFYICYVEESDFNLCFSERLLLTFSEILFWPLIIIVIAYLMAKGEI